MRLPSLPRGQRENRVIRLQDHHTDSTRIPKSRPPRSSSGLLPERVGQASSLRGLELFLCAPCTGGSAGWKPCDTAGLETCATPAARLDIGFRDQSRGWNPSRCDHGQPQAREGWVGDTPSTTPARDSVVIPHVFARHQMHALLSLNSCVSLSLRGGLRPGWSRSPWRARWRAAFTTRDRKSVV